MKTMKLAPAILLIVSIFFGCASTDSSTAKSGSQTSYERMEFSRQRAISLFKFGLTKIDRDPEAAVSAFADAAQISDEMWEASYNAGLAYLKLNEPEKALKELNSALKRDAPRSLVYTAIGSAHLMTGSKDEAEDAFKRALKAERNITTITNIANMYHSGGDIDGALKLYLEAEALEPSNKQLNFNLGVLLYKKGNYRGALEKFLKADYHAENVMVVAMTYVKTGDTAGALQVLSKTAERFPENPEPLKYIGVIYELYLGDMKKAVNNYSAYVDKGGKDSERVRSWIEISRSRSKKEEESGS